MKAKTSLIGSEPLKNTWAIFVLLLRVIETIWKKRFKAAYTERRERRKKRRVVTAKENK